MIEYLKDWNEACVYAKECLPPFAYDITREPFSAILLFAGLSLAIYLVNEYLLNKQ